MATSVLLPLYIYPSFLGYWDPIYASISANPTLNFNLVINVDSGPGINPSIDPFPNSDYVAGLAKLHSYPNTQLYGYVHTTYGTEPNGPNTPIQANITKYNAWSTHVHEDIHVDGIFFDEVWGPVDEGNYTYLSDLVAYTHNTLGPQAKVIFNPGVIPDSRMYGLADTIIGFENGHSSYSDAVLKGVDAQYAKQTAFLIHTLKGDAEVQAKIVRDVKAAGLGGLFLTTKTLESNPFNDTSVLWDQFCKAMA